MRRMKPRDRAGRELALLTRHTLPQELQLPHRQHDTSKAMSPELWDMDKPLLRLSSFDLWTLRDAYEGVIIFGGIGSGKTSGSGRAIRKAMLRHGFGGLVLTAKPNEVETWQRDCEACGRADDIVRFSPESGERFNVFDYELKRSGRGSGFTQNIVEIVGSAFDASMGNTGRSGSGDEHWVEARDCLIGRTIDLCVLADGTVSIPALLEIVRAAPTSLASDSWKPGSLFFKKLQAAKASAQTRDEFETYKGAVAYFGQFASWDERYRSSVLAMFTTSADRLVRPPFASLFSGTSTITPQDTFAGKILILDLPVSQFQAVGRSAQVLTKTAWQMDVLRRTPCSTTHPVFLYADEAQNFVSSYDAVFQNQAREARAATVYLTQNISNVLTAMRARGGEDAAKSLIANLQTKIFHANCHYETNKWAEQLIGEEIRFFRSGSYTWSYPGPTLTAGTSEQFTPRVRADEFTTLRTGGRACGHRIDAFIVQSGRQWNATDANFLNVVFKQAPNNE